MRFTRAYQRPSMTIDSNESANATICRPCFFMNGFLLAYSANGRAIVSRSSSVSKRRPASRSDMASSSTPRNTISTYHSVMNRITIREKKSIHSSRLGALTFGSVVFFRRRLPNPLLSGSSSSSVGTIAGSAVAMASIASAAFVADSASAGISGSMNSGSPINSCGAVPSDGNSGSSRTLTLSELMASSGSGRLSASP